MKRGMAKHMQMTLLMFAFILSGCAGMRVQKLAETQPQGSAFTMALAKEYLVFSSRENSQFYDQISASYFARKGLDAAIGVVVPPETLDRWKIPLQCKDEMQAARDRLVAALNAPALTEIMADLAKAQVNFDCWVEEQDENSQPENIAFCRNNYIESIDMAEQKLSAVNQPRPSLLPTSAYSTYYKPGQTDVPVQASPIIDQLMALIQQMSDYRMVIDGHTDRTGSSARNIVISEQRAAKMKTAFVSRGVEDQRVKTFAFGESQAAGKKGASSACDRRVDITLFVPENDLLKVGASN